MFLEKACWKQSKSAQPKYSHGYARARNRAEEIFGVTHDLSLGSSEDNRNEKTACSYVYIGFYKPVIQLIWN